MAWWGKLIGGAFGYMLGGPLGALLGAVLGHNLDAGLRRMDQLDSAGPFAFDERERTQSAFFTATFAVMGHIAKADGRVTADELQVATRLMRQMNLTPELVRAAQELFKQGKAPAFPLDEVLDQFRQECHRSRNLVRMFVEIQLFAAYADGSVHPEERRILIYICQRLGVAADDFARLEAMIQAEVKLARGGDAGPSVADAYAILNVSPDVSDADLKRAYRRLMSQHHPDKLVAKGLPEEMMKLATEKTREIKQAYDRIKEARGL